MHAAFVVRSDAPAAYGRAYDMERGAVGCSLDSGLPLLASMACVRHPLDPCLYPSCESGVPSSVSPSVGRSSTQADE